MHEVLVNRLGGLSLPRKSVVRLIDRPDMTLDVYRGRKTTIQQQQQQSIKKKKKRRFYAKIPGNQLPVHIPVFYGRLLAEHFWKSRNGRVILEMFHLHRIFTLRTVTLRKITITYYGGFKMISTSGLNTM